MTYPPFPFGNDLLDALYRQHIQNMLSSLTAKKALVDSHRPPTSDDVKVFIASSTDKAILRYLEEIAAIEKDLKETKEQLELYVKGCLYTPTDADARDAAKKSFTALRNNLLKYLHSLASTASVEGNPEVVEWSNQVMEQLPKLTGSRASQDLKAAREWLQENRPEAEIKTRGPIPLEWLQEYYKHKDD